MTARLPPEPDWLTTELRPGARVLLTTCAGGVSQGEFASLNLGDHVGDAPEAVARNRARLAQSLPARPVFLKQVHGTHIALLDEATPDGLAADGAIATRPGLACVVMVADCLPILLAHTQRPLVAALHAGWRGLAGEGGQGVLEAAFARLQALAGEAAEPLSEQWRVWLGPCIGPAQFEVGPEVREAFVQSHPAAEACFVPVAGGKHLADLPALAQLRLQALGLPPAAGNDGSPAWCTVSQSRFFSHRRLSRLAGRPGATGGRMAACIWLD